ncbi:hypothetical protein AQUCO_04900112v1 [Aquilegia coerulea]|uniref:Uncharacterized protein n=1 Tax=Aquilegia coerulea TaxID=218851 RepID=A0A2G5CJX0_AQUCA|nr:hypothetical protein AQUCO_04900112v1 [Aquilegia coerulea]
MLKNANHLAKQTKLYLCIITKISYWLQLNLIIISLIVLQHIFDQKGKKYICLSAFVKLETEGRNSTPHGFHLSKTPLPDDLIIYLTMFF